MAGASGFHHVILTRFNCSNSRNPNDREIAIRSRPGWLEERFTLFERYCLPSVLRQSDQNFRWHIYFDRRTPQTYLERARRGIGDRTNVLIKLCDIYGSETIQEDLPNDLAPSHDWLVTTRFDNDDALDQDFVLRLRDAVRVGTPEALNFPLGIVHQGDRFYLSRQESNAFISLSEPFANIQTMLCERHNEISRRFVVRNIDGDAAWLQVVHSSNVSNKIRGLRIARSRVPHSLAKLCAASGPEVRESAIAIAMENVSAGALRLVRDRLGQSIRHWTRLGKSAAS